MAILIKRRLLSSFDLPRIHTKLLRRVLFYAALNYLEQIKKKKADRNENSLCKLSARLKFKGSKNDEMIKYDIQNNSCPFFLCTLLITQTIKILSGISIIYNVCFYYYHFYLQLFFWKHLLHSNCIFYFI